MTLAIEWAGGDFVAMAAILVGGGVSIAAVRVAARSEEKARRKQGRLENYSAILPIVWRIMRQASEMSYTPGLTVTRDPDEEEVLRAEALLVLIGSPQVVSAFREWRNQLAPYWASVWGAAQARRRADELMPTDGPPREGWERAQGEAERERVNLGIPLGQLMEATEKLEAAMRADL